MISTRKLAEIAGVSQSTIVRCLNDFPNVSPKTKERVRELARQNGYIMQRVGRRDILKSHRKAIVLMVLHNLSYLNNFFINKLIFSVMEAIEHHNYFVIVMHDCYGQQGIEKSQDLLKLNLVEGFIIINQQYDDLFPKWLEGISIPHVFLVYHRRSNEIQYNIIDTDNYKGGYIATKHLIDLGHKKIICLTAPLPEYNDRMRGYQAALKDYDIEFDHKLVISTTCNYDSVYNKVINLIPVFQCATACFAQFDIGAIAVCNALKEFNIDIPNDISLVGFDGQDFLSIYNPAITTIRQPYEELSKQAVNMIIQKISSPNKVVFTKTYLDPELVIRNSTIPCKNAV